MRPLRLVFCITMCFGIQAAHIAGQSVTDSLSAMEKTLNSAETAITPEDSYYLGRAVAAHILSIYKPYTQNAELTRYLNRICQTIAINSPQPEIYSGYYVIIIDSPEYNAFATPGGHILISRGLVEAAVSEDMLAAIIAHELAHIILQHGVGIIADTRLNDDLASTAARAGGIAAQHSATAARAVLLGNAVTQLIDVMMKNGYSQAQEFQADTTAIILLAAAGYNPAALSEMLKVLQRNQSVQKGGFDTTHPSPAARIQNAEKMNGRYRIQDTSSYRVPRFKKTVSP